MQKKVLDVRNVSKTFKIPLDGSSGIKQKILNLARHKKGYRNFTPLNGVSFDVYEGEFFGIVGRNGSGKSTLLKTIAGIYAPNEGSVTVNGLLVPFIELGVGFNPELTGRENVYLNAALLGFSPKEVDAMYEEIVDFAELHDFMEEQLKNYSSGMQVRLAFSIAIRAKGDVLLLDEVLAVGDSAFQQKCFDYFEQLKDENRTIVLVTHSMDAVKRFCTRAMLIEEGHIKVIGSPAEVADQYTIDNIAKKIDKSKEHNTETSDTIKLLEASIEKREYFRDDTLKLTASYILTKEFDPVVGLSIVRDGRSIAEVNSTPIFLDNQPGTPHKTTIDIELSAFTVGTYTINISIFERNSMKLLDYRIGEATFVIKGDDKVHGGSVYINAGWKQEKSNKE